MTTHPPQSWTLDRSLQSAPWSGCRVWSRVSLQAAVHALALGRRPAWDSRCAPLEWWLVSTGGPASVRSVLLSKHGHLGLLCSTIGWWERGAPPRP